MGQLFAKPQTPEEVKANIVKNTPIKKELLTAAPLEYLLPKITTPPIYINNFLRWGERDESGNYIYDPDQDLTAKVIEVTRSTGLVPSIYYEDGDYFWIFNRNIESGVHVKKFPMTEFLRAVELIQSQKIIYFVYMITNINPRTGKNDSHAVLLNKINPMNIELMDSNGLGYEDLLKTMTPPSRIFTTSLFRRANINQPLPSMKCVFQTNRRTCGLWATLFALYPNTQIETIKSMVDIAIRKIGLPLNVTSYDMFIMELFYQFIQNPVLASKVNVKEHMEGFGKLKGGMEKKFRDALKSYVETLKTQSPIITGRFNPLVKTYYGNEADPLAKNLFRFILQKTDRRDMYELGFPIGPDGRVQYGVIPALDLLHFVIYGTHNINELYRKFVPWFPTIEEPTLETDFVDYKTRIQAKLMKYIINVLERRKERQELLTKREGKPTKNPPVEFSIPAKKGLGKVKRGKAMPENLNFLQQIAKQSYNLVDPEKVINGWVLKKWNSTMKFYVKGNDVVVGVRGTKANAPDGNYDLTADSTIPFNGIPGTTRYKRDKAAMQQFQQEYPPDEYNYYAVGHSLGGAIIDSLIRQGFIKEATSYNPAIQYSDINAGLPNRRIYYGSDPLYRLMGWWDRKSEHREPENRTWADFLSSVSPAAAVVAALPAHKLENFQGGKRGKKIVFT
jgi:hypothetical protein